MIKFFETPFIQTLNKKHFFIIIQCLYKKKKKEENTVIQLKQKKNALVDAIQLNFENLVEFRQFKRLSEKEATREYTQRPFQSWTFSPSFFIVQGSPNSRYCQFRMLWTWWWCDKT